MLWRRRRSFPRCGPPRIKKEISRPRQSHAPRARLGTAGAARGPPSPDRGRKELLLRRRALAARRRSGRLHLLGLLLFLVRLHLTFCHRLSFKQRRRWRRDGCARAKHPLRESEHYITREQHQSARCKLRVTPVAGRREQLQGSDVSEYPAWSRRCRRGAHTVLQRRTAPARSTPHSPPPARRLRRHPAIGPRTPARSEAADPGPFGCREERAGFCRFRGGSHCLVFP